MFNEIESGDTEGHTCETNLAEFYYKTCERLGREVAEVRNTSLRHSRLSIMLIDEALTRFAGGLKCVYRGKLSLADAYVLAAAKMKGGVLVTTDSRIAELKLAPINFLKIP